MTRTRPAARRRSSAVAAATLCLFLSGSAGGLAGGEPAKAAPDRPPDFLREVRPILAGHCFKCHGPDPAARKAALRLDEREAATGPARSGKRAIAPGRPEESELVRRIFAADESDRMPPASTHNPLTEAKRETLRRWIAAGAEYRPHWAFLPPRQAPLPAVEHAEWCESPLDRFVLARLEAEGLEPSPPADRFTLLRRVHLDLLGLPPDPEDADAFERDSSPGAYERLVDRLLDSPRYGERWARRWLDLARYADTNGYEKDRPRSIWLWRDWVIRAINGDLPFDRFTIEQLAGDMLSGATIAQRVATGFHRNTMTNEEGGIDPLEFRFYSIVDRANTTATTWLGLTMGCAQCHSHKYDPVSQKEYYRFLAYLDNADEPELEVPDPRIEARRAEIEREAALRESTLADRFPPEVKHRLDAPPPLRFEAESGSKFERLSDGSLRLSGPAPEKDVYRLTVETDLAAVSQLRIEALTDPALPSSGPGRAPNGNFVLNEIELSAAPRGSGDPAQPVKLARAEADFSQHGFPAAGAIDGKPATGWAVDGAGNAARTLTVSFEKPAGFPGGTRFTARLAQSHGGRHTLGRFRLVLVEEIPDARPLEERRREHRERKFAEWLERERARAVRWTTLRPLEARSQVPVLLIQDDGSILATSDQTKSDLYELKLRSTVPSPPGPPKGASDLPALTAIRLEALPDDRLPRGGPGRVYYEGPFGDFYLSTISLSAAGRPLKLAGASQTHASGDNTAARAIDDDPQTGWSISGGQGRRQEAVFRLAEPLAGAGDLEVRMLFERYYAAGLGRFRISGTSDPRPAEARPMSDEVREILLRAGGELGPEERSRVFAHWLTVAPELAPEREAIAKLRSGKPAHPTTLGLAERPPGNARKTHLRRRGEFLQPEEEVAAGLPASLLPPGAERPRDRLELARWLVSPQNPLGARVTVNRQWEAFFGRGLVRTVADFGFQGELPTHPELLDWLAVECLREGWSLKRLHRLLVTSATYRQSSRVTPELLSRDPQNLLLARGPRLRLEAELVRDAALQASGLLSGKIGGPSVFPPQPPSVTREGAYGPLEWQASPGEDRYRRGLYTFAKRTAPYAMFTTFDAPSGEACTARREVSNTPLQSLMLLNDEVFLEAAQALGRRAAAEEGLPEERARQLFRRILTRPPGPEELERILRFHAVQLERLRAGEIRAQEIAGPGAGDPVERAAWTLVARTLLNLDEAVTKE